jgi:CheY-like chemotaxis protein
MVEIASSDPAESTTSSHHLGHLRAWDHLESPLKLILLVDDSKFQRIASERLLAKSGYLVITAADGEEALRLAVARNPDLVLLDMLLPKLSGPDVLKALKANPDTAKIPVVVLTSLAQKNEAKLIKDGATAYFEKSKLDLNQDSGAFLRVVTVAIGDDTPSAKAGLSNSLPLDAIVTS